MLKTLNKAAERAPVLQTTEWIRRAWGCRAVFSCDFLGFGFKEFRASGFRVPGLHLFGVSKVFSVYTYSSSSRS